MIEADPDNLIRLPDREHKHDLSMSDELSMLARDNGWTVKRRTSTYFTATKHHSPSDAGAAGADSTVIGIWVHGKAVLASRCTVCEETGSAEAAQRWLVDS